LHRRLQHAGPTDSETRLLADGDWKGGDRSKSRNRRPVSGFRDFEIAENPVRKFKIRPFEKLVKFERRSLLKNLSSKKIVLSLIVFSLIFVSFSWASEHKASKPSPDEVLNMLKEGNQRFYTGKATYPHTNAARLEQAGKENQGDHAYATVISCSDSRVPVELIFDAGVMDIFVIRVAGNVCDTDEIGSIEYGAAHVNTPIVLVLGHTQCGAVTAVTKEIQGHGHKLERNIPPLVDNIVPAVKKAMDLHKDVEGEAIIPFAIEQNIWQGVEDLFTKSPAVRNLVKEGKIKVVGAMYDVSTGKVDWLPSTNVDEILKKVEAAPDKIVEPYAEKAN
jgi:carbonic anhydrase